MGACDFHCHLIPGVDDGSADVDQSRIAIAAMQAEGVESIITTPHFNAELTLYPQYLAARLRQIDEGWEVLRAMAETEFPGVKLGRGVELMLDVPDPDLSDSRLRLGGGRFLLIEFPGMTIPPNSVAALARLVEHHFAPIIAHPERYDNIRTRGGIAKEWNDAGAMLQVNCRSLTGDYGRDAQQNARGLLESGLVSFFSSDYHARGSPGIQKTRELFSSWNADDLFYQLTVANPSQMFAGELPAETVPLSPKPTLWNSLKSYLAS